MRACVQRVREASVTVEGEVIARVGQGLLILLGVAQEDAESDAHWLAEKIVGLRIFEANGRMDASLLDVKGELLVVSQFTLLADCRKGKRPSFTAAAPPERAEALYNEFCSHAARLGAPVHTGRFRANMQVALTNDGPVTVIVETPSSFAPNGARQPQPGAE